VSHLVPDGCGDTDRPGLGESLDASGDVDPLSVDLIAVHHDVTEMDTDAKLHAPVGGTLRVAGLERALDLDGGAYGVESAGELSEEVVPR
jgi:hypothetical protein